MYHVIGLWISHSSFASQRIQFGFFNYHRSKVVAKAAGIQPGERQLLGPQTSGRVYKNLSTPHYGIKHHYALRIPMRDGITLLADLYLPDVQGRSPVLIA